MEEVSIDIKSDIMALQLSDPDTELKVAANILGYKEMPVDIDTFMDDPYYMGNVSGNLYPFWRELLRKIFPTPIHTSTPILVFTGGIGTGKSTCVRFMAEYMKYRIACLRNPYHTLGFVPGKNLKFSYFHKTNTLAQTDFVDVMDSWEEMSPFFKDAYKDGKLEILEQVCDSIRSNNQIGSDVLFYNLSELNFISYDRAHEKLDAALKRWSSRFERVRNYFGMVIIDTSSQGDDSIADNFIKNNPYGDLVRPVYTNRWIVREHLNYYGQKGWFKIYCGDSINEPFIVDEEKGRIITPEMDPDRVLEVPEECRADFEFDIITALQDIAGISTSSSDKFFKEPALIKKCMTLPQYGGDVVKFDFYDKTDKFIYKFRRTLDDIPKDRVIFFRSDTAVVGDNMGLAIAYFDGWKVYDGNQKVKHPIIKVPLAVGVSRHEGEETSLQHLYEFILDLNEEFEIGNVTFDQFQSRMILQNLTRDGIPNRYLSVDRTDEAGIYTKSLITAGLLHLPLNNLLLAEATNLRRIGNKLDHINDGQWGHSKDIFDSVSGVVFDLYQNLDKAGTLSKKYKVNSYVTYMSQSASHEDSFKDMLGSIY